MTFGMCSCSQVHAARADGLRSVFSNHMTVSRRSCCGCRARAPTCSNRMPKSGVKRPMPARERSAYVRRVCVPRRCTVVDILELPADIFVPARCDIHTARVACCVSFCLVTVPRCVMHRFCAEALLVLSQASKVAKTLVARDALYAARRGLQLVVREPSRTPRCRHGFPPGGQLVYEFQRRGGTGHVHTAHGTVVLTFCEYILRYVAK